MGGFCWSKTAAETAEAAVLRRMGNDGFLLAAQEAKRLMERFVPMDTGALARSAVCSAEGNRGVVTYTAPYAAFCYYGSGVQFSRQRNTHAAAFWDKEAMKLYGGVLADYVNNNVSRR